MPKGVFRRSPEHCENISIALTGMKRSLETRRKISIIASARKLSDEQKEKIGDSMRGEKHWHWQGGITGAIYSLRKTKEYRHWRDAVLKRDGHKCKKCGATERRLDAHHIFSFTEYPERRFDMGNGITLCVKCHTKYGSKIIQPYLIGGDK